MTSDTSSPAAARQPGSASDISGPFPGRATPPLRRRPGAAATVLPERFASVFTDYVQLVARPGGPLDSDSVRVYCSRVRCYLTWLAGALAAGEVDGDPWVIRLPGTGLPGTIAPICRPWPNANPPPSTPT